MARGGYRPNAGRPKGAKSLPPLRPEEVRMAAAERGVTPLEFMLALVADPTAPAELRLRAAMAAAPYVHDRAGARGRKHAAEEVAREAEPGTDWERLLS